MRTFEYKGFDARGVKRRGMIEALGVKDARERLAAGGILAERVGPAAGAGRMSVAARIAFYEALSALLSAGVPMLKAFDILLESPRESGETGFLAGVRDGVREGGSLGAALGGEGGAIGAFERATIESAERSATLDTALQRLAAFLEEREAMRRQARGALVYPALVAGVGLCTAIVMLGILVPKTEAILYGSGIPLPLLTRVFMAAGRWTTRWGGVAAVVAVLAAAAVRARFRRDAAWRERADRLLFRVPFVGNAHRLGVNYRFASTLAVLLRGGVSLIEGIEQAGRATGSPWVASAAVAAAGAVRHGEPFSQAVGAIAPVADALSAWIRVGEASGSLDRLMEAAAAHYRARWSRCLSLGLSLLEPALILAIGGFVLLVALSVLLPVLRLSQAL